MGMRDKLRALATPGYSGPTAVPSEDRHVASPTLIVKPKRSIKEMLRKGVVGHSQDFSRIMALPRRPKPDLGPIAHELHARLRKPGGTMELREIQAWLLWEGPTMGGLIAQVNVGGGKTLPGLLMPMLMPSCRRAVLFIPPGLRAQLLERDWDNYGKHFNLPNLAGGKWFIPGRPVLHVIAYSELSNAKSTDLLEKEIQPDLIVCDEVQNLKARDSARTKRVLRHFAKHHETRFCGWSGTITDKSVADYAHLSALALGEGSPVPLHYPTVEEWAAALDPHMDGFWDPGQLMKFCEPGEDVRSGFRRRLIDTAGVVATAANKLGTALNFFERQAPPMPESLKKAMENVRKNWIRPDEPVGEELVDALSVLRCLRQLAVGGFSRWRFPRGEPPELINRWFNARQDWNRELRERLAHSRPHLDSPYLCARAAARWHGGGCKQCNRGSFERHERGCLEAEKHPVWEAEAWPAWHAIAKQVHHETETVWVSDFLLRDAAAWGAEQPGIIWVEHVEFGQVLSKMSGMPYFGEGTAASAAILQETGSRSIIASVKAHGVGKNLQHAFWRNLVTTPPASGETLEQLIGRSHREGQTRDEVEVYFYRHTPELHDALDKAKERAKYVQETTGSAQKLVYGTWGFQ